MDSLIILLIVVGAIAAFVIAIYNKLVTLKNRVEEAWSDIDVQLKRRYNLIPNIVETVKGYATHEEGVLTKVTEARSNAINANGVQEQGAAENMLSGALKSLFAVAENYPQLKANENFMQLQNELVDTEDKIQAARRFYNGVVRDLNTKIEMFPSNIIAGMFKFEKREFFEIENEEEKQNVKVSFDKEATPNPSKGGESKVEVAPVPAPTPVVEPEMKEEEKSMEMTEASATPEKPVEEKMEAPAVPGEMKEASSDSSEGGEAMEGDQEEPKKEA